MFKDTLEGSWAETGSAPSAWNSHTMLPLLQLTVQADAFMLTLEEENHIAGLRI